VRDLQVALSSGAKRLPVVALNRGTLLQPAWPRLQTEPVRTWPHAPSKEIVCPGQYIVTAGTYGKIHHFHGESRLTYLHDSLLESAEALGWRLEAWAVFPNHYHFVGTSPDSAEAVHALTKRVHMATAHFANVEDGTRGRTVWYRSWDTLLTFEKSYLARLAYVHQNPVKHGLVAQAVEYPWCSAAWFSKSAPKAFVETVLSFKTDKVNVIDDF
jgi:putative transposase